MVAGLPHLVAEQWIRGRLSQEDQNTISLGYGVGVLCGFTDGEHDIRKPKHMWTDDDLEPVQMMDTETRKVIAMLLVILEQMSGKFVYSRRMKDLLELEAQDEATISKSASDDQKLRMHSEFKAICLTDETRLWSMECFDQQAEHQREMHARDSESDRIARQCSDDEGCLCIDMVESKNVFDTSTFNVSVTQTARGTSAIEGLSPSASRAHRWQTIYVKIFIAAWYRCLFP